jgi:hypothetical protein
MKIYGALLISTLALTGCASWGKQTLGETRKNAKLVLMAYETAQEGIIFYGHLPDCAPTAPKFCRDKEVWTRIQIYNKLATNAIQAAEPVLNGEQVDAGEIIAAYNAISTVKSAYAEAMGKLK